MKNLLIAALLAGIAFAGCKDNKKANHNDADTTATKTSQQVDLPAPYETESAQKYSNVIGWPQGKTPVAPEEFTVSLFADSLRNPRNIYVATNGDIFISEANTEAKGVKKVGAAVKGVIKSQNMGKSANDILLFRDTNGDGKYDLKTVFLKGLNQPYGIEIIGNWFYVANTDGVWRYPYKAGQTKINVPGKMIIDLPAGGYNNHWTRNLLSSKDGKKLFISVGSGSNVAEHGMSNEIRRANILEINPDGSGERIYAAGLRNPVGMDWNPADGKLYVAVNERDKLGDELVPDYVTAVQEGGFYGWPYAYFGQHEDPSFKGPKKPELVKKTLVPDLAVGSHTASLGLAFYNGDKFPEKYKNGIFIGQHGSWNSSKWVGYKVVFAPFKNGKPTGKLEDFLTGFIADAEKGDVYGRPVEIGVLKDGSILVTDDASNRIWRVAAK
ncbi:sorbosone dehydrogenase family protein [Mucilaginibacter limnophilus]|uniref:Sorbosone dehydrogenase family protein n=1 Tax=Mucilaginibacter limnophilus TaxID=1932778 RepID=A0A437MV44_9SPHI|nr:sorbosone dehydrogenase family protein [Mucilaginibacter limnophilus]RVU01521.1 sorbosone dehydrogenase family protein [Mucilaginibacter limnophilus]